jgi:hypothetical protein
MSLSEAVLAFAAVVTVSGFMGLALMYRSLRRSEPPREATKL